MGQWFLPFLHGWRSEAARRCKMAKKPADQRAELSVQPQKAVSYFLKKNHDMKILDHHRNR
jgi:hypothetical protein